MQLFRALRSRAPRASHQAVRRHLFIVTYARSGSTILQKLIGSIAGCHLTGENNDALGGLWESYKRAADAKSLQGSEPRQDSGDPWRGAHRIDPPRYNRRLTEVFVDEIIQPPPGASIVGFKEVRYFDYGEALPDYLDYIRTSFEPSLLVFNKRAPEDVARSGWWKDHPADIAAEVRRFDEIAADYARKWPDSTMIVDYDLYSRDVGHLRPLFERLGAPFDAARLEKILAVRLNH